MITLNDIAGNLPPHHKEALFWFFEHTGMVNPWPQPIQVEGESLNGTVLLTNKAKGIYKPKWSEYALSVRHSLDSPYYDKDPIFRDDGTWSYLYYQENSDPSMRDQEYTNRGLMRCKEDVVPVGVFRQVVRKPDPKYEILGVAIVSGWEEGYFLLEGFSKQGEANEPSPQPLIDALIAGQLTSEAGIIGVDPKNIIDAREKTLSTIVRRRGQVRFRRDLLEAYKGHCAITRCDAVEALEAVHIIPYQGEYTNNVSNGLLFRADIHTLFDLGLIAIDSQDMRIKVSPVLCQTEYANLKDIQLALPENPQNWPSIEALNYHRGWARL
ncbi:HNH endonuclease [Chloroflexota bacterium]